MFRRTFTLSAIGLLFIAPLTLSAQEAEEISDADQLRRLISALETKLEAAEAATKPRVAQIGRYSEQQNVQEKLIRIYRLDDLFVLAPAYNALKSTDLSNQASPIFPQAIRAAGGGAQTPFVTSIVPLVGSPAGVTNPFGIGTSAVQEQRTSSDDLIEVITSVIEPSSWDEVGGENSISMLGSSLVVKAEAEVHQQIDSMLELMRSQSRALRTVTVSAYWLWLGEAELQSLLPAAGQKAAGQKVVSVAAVDGEAFNKLLLADENPVEYRAEMTCHNGQTVHSISGDQNLAVTDMIAVAVPDPQQSGKSTTVYRPQVAVIQAGAALQVTPAITTSGKIVVLDIHSRVVTPREAAPAAKAVPAKVPGGEIASPTEIVASLDRPRMTVHQLSTTMRVPVDQTVLVGGMTMQSSDAEKGNLYLFTRVRVEELVDDATESDSVGDAVESSGDAVE